MMLKGKKLEKAIGIFCSSNPLAKDRTEMGLDTIKKLGFKANFSLPPYQYYADYTYGFTNGSKEQRLESIRSCLLNKEVSVLVASRGGTGSLDLLGSLPLEEITKQRKILVGQSDVTVLLLQSAFKAQVPAIFGPTLGAEFANYENSEDAKESVHQLIEILSDNKFRLSLNGEKITGREPVQGRLVGGNLSMLLSLLGTEYDVDYKGGILFIEEVGEPPYKIQRMLRQLILARKLDSVKGICFGRFSKCESKEGPSVGNVIEDFIKALSSVNNCPVLINLPFGHWGKSLPIPLGINAEISGSQLRTLESPIE